MTKKVLLVEPDYIIRYPNLALMKFSTYYKSLGYEVQYIKGERLISPHPEIILISTMFTYYAKQTIRCISFYKSYYPNSKIRVGGISASLIPEYIEKNTGIKPEIGCLDWLDRITPDYGLLDPIIKESPYVEKWRDFSILFSTRGCQRNCHFCAVHQLEPKNKIIDNWKDHIDLKRHKIMLQDNNITATSIEHYKDVMNFIIKNKLRACFNNGFDARILNDEQIYYLTKIKWCSGGLRVAFDNMSEDKHVQNVIKKILKAGISRCAFLVFCLFNFEDTFEEAMYRHQEIADLDVRPYPQPYIPLNWLDKSKPYISKNWTRELAYEFRQYWILAGRYKNITFTEYLKSIGKTYESLINPQPKKDPVSIFQ